MKSLYPEYVGPDNAYMMLATVHRRLSDTAAERKVLEELAARDGSASPAYLRLMELDDAASDWKNLARDARRLLAVNPLIPAPYRNLARAAEHLGQPDVAMTALRAVAMLDESDPAGVHYRLAKLLNQAGRRDERVEKSSDRSKKLPGSRRPTNSCSIWSKRRRILQLGPVNPRRQP